jgi:outer membrane receptor protein involved in Fe transport
LYRASLVLAALVASATGMSAQASGQVVTGVVRDSLSRVGMSGVEVIAAGRRVTTDAEGRFQIEVPGDTTTLLIRRIGFAPRRLRARALGDEVLLAPEPVLLTGITITAAPAQHIGSGSALGMTTVDEATLASRGETSLASALGVVEGISSQQPGAWGGKAFLRGLGGERVTVLLDGDRVNRACNFGMDGSLATISPATVERVEILSGPGSVLYGSGNVGGVINVVTRSAQEDRAVGAEFRAGASSAVPGASLGGSFFLRRDRVRLELSADGAAYDDYRTGRATVNGSSYRDATLDGRLAVRLPSTHRVELHVQRYFGREIGYPAMPGTEIPTEDRLLTALDYGWQVSRGMLDGVSAKVYRQGIDHYMTMSMTMDMGGMPMTTRTVARTTSATYGARSELRLRPSSGSRIDAGVEATQWNADGTRWVTRGAGTPMPSTLMLQAWPDVRLIDAGAFAQGEAQVTSWAALSAGGRLDRIVNRADDRGTTTEWVPTGNVGVRLSAPSGVTVRGSLGYGYRVADPTELFGLVPRPDGFLYLGNPDLRTETSRNLELAAGLVRGRLDAGATVYRNELTDLITPVLLADSMISGYAVRQYTNLTRARIDGVTGRLGLELPARLQLRGVVSYAHGENRQTGGALAAIPPLEGRVALRLTPGATLQWAEFEVHGASRQSRAATTAGEIVTPGFAVLNARAMIMLARTDLTLGVDNVLDREYRQHLDPTRLFRPGRNFYVRLRRSI